MKTPLISKKKFNKICQHLPPHGNRKRINDLYVINCDGFEITCDNGEKVRAIFVLDCCDREIIAFSVSTGGYTSEMAQNAIPGAVERRFGCDKTSKLVE